ncbi:MAG: hypothetical protein ACXVA9_10850 [Bdellovibrionales bacterium]
MGTLATVMVIGLVVTTTGFYFYLFLFHPEWIGITGKSAHKTLNDHKEGSQVDDSDII